jgi:hypothetical protein
VAADAQLRRRRREVRLGSHWVVARLGSDLGGEPVAALDREGVGTGVAFFEIGMDRVGSVVGSAFGGGEIDLNFAGAESGR